MPASVSSKGKCGTMALGDTWTLMRRGLGHLRGLGRALASRGGARVSAGWSPYSRLLVVGDQGGWVLDEERRELEEIARRIGIHVASPYWAPWVSRQAVFYCSQFILETTA